MTLPDLQPLGTLPLLAIRVRVGTPVDVGGGRCYVPLVGGTFTGREGLHGDVLPGGADWQRTRPDGTIEISAHYALRTESGSGIEVSSRGLRRVSPQVTARLAAGEPVDPSEFYFRTHIVLTTADPALDHLNHSLGISTGQRDAGEVHIHVHEVL